MIVELEKSRLNSCMEENLDDAVNDILAQLKQATNIISRPVSTEEEAALTKDQLEEFIIKNTGKLVTQSISLVDTVKEVVETSATPNDVSALAELIKAASAAVDSLNRVYISDERNKTQVKTKQMDVDSRERVNMLDNQAKLLLSREEILKAILDEQKDPVLVGDDAAIIDV